MDITKVTLEFTAGMATAYKTCREFTQARIYQIGIPQKVIAADMDYSPSQLSRKLAQSEADSARFTLDDLEQYMQVTGDLTPISYLIEKYHNPKMTRKEQLLAELAQLEAEQVANNV